MNITIDPSLKELFPAIRIGSILSSVKVERSSELLIEEVRSVCNQLEQHYSPELIRKHPVVDMTRKAYRMIGQDPNRYRPAAESLLRRISSGKGLYFVNNMVDILNLVSVQTGFSIGGYDADFINGDVSFGIGRRGEPYEGIGRGILNIDCLPVFRDNNGAFGTSTSDSVRTMVTDKTKRFLMIIPAFTCDNENLNISLDLAVKLLKKFGNVSDYDVFISDEYAQGDR